MGKKIVFGGLVALIIVSGCLSSQQSDARENVLSVEENCLDNFTGTRILDCFYEAAIEKGAADLCMNVKEEDVLEACGKTNDKSWCELSATAGILQCVIEVGKSKKDTAACNVLENNERIDYCTAAVEGREEEEMKRQMESFEEITKKAQENEGPEVCNQTNNSILQGVCIQKVAIAKKDPSLCKNLLGENICLAEVAIAKDDLEFCKTLRQKEYCTKGIAIKRLDPSICKQLNERVAMCVTSIAIQSENQEVCSELTTEEEIDYCKNLSS